MLATSRNHRSLLLACIANRSDAFPSLVGPPHVLGSPHTCQLTSNTKNQTRGVGSLCLSDVVYADINSVNIFGLANDVNTYGSAYSAFGGFSCNASNTAYPFYDPKEHFYAWRDLGFNLFRLPIAWQHAQVTLGGPLNETTMKHYDTLINTITSNGSQAIIDVHNYARWYCSIIGQPLSLNYVNQYGQNVSDEHFVDLWTKLASRYRSNQHVLFQLMNEPHDLNITLWAETNQKVINALRALNLSQPILVSGTQFARLTNWIDYSEAALATVHDPANNILFDFHQYFDDMGGAYGVCEPWTTFLPQFEAVTNVLRARGIKGILTEFGGGPDQQCIELFEKLLGYLEDNRDVWYGWTAWGSFNTGSPLELSLDEKSPFYKLTEVLKRFAPLK